LFLFELVFPEHPVFLFFLRKIEPIVIKSAGAPHDFVGLVDIFGVFHALSSFHLIDLVHLLEFFQGRGELTLQAGGVKCRDC
jgi:hypothetical protein